MAALHRSRCWGENNQGQLGLGHDYKKGHSSSPPHRMGDYLEYVNLGEDKAKEVACGSQNTCVLLTNNRVKCWGSSTGALGYGDTERRGRTEDTTPDKLPYVNLGTGLTPLHLFASSSQAQFCVIFDNGGIKCWGYTESPTSTEDMWIGDDPGEMGDALPYLNL